MPPVLGILACCGRLAVTFAAALASLAVLFHTGPDAVALALYGSSAHLPDRLGLSELLVGSASYSRPCAIGSTRYSHAPAYGASTWAAQKFPQAAVDAYASEGYVVLQGLLPPRMVEELRHDLLRVYSIGDEKNAHLGFPPLLDFLTLGPLGAVASQLFGGSPTHLLRSVLHFRPTATEFRRVPSHHYDWLECAEEPSAVNVSKDAVKMFVPLYDNMPAPWFVNKSSFASLAVMEFGPEAALNLKAGPGGPGFSDEALDGLSHRPRLRLGDVLVHSLSLAHRSPTAPAGAAVAFISPSYAAASSRCTGRASSNRECDWGTVVPASAPESVGEGAQPLPPRISEVQRPACFPQVSPPQFLGHGPDCEVQLRPNFNARPYRRLLSSAVTRWMLLAPPQPPPTGASDPSADATGVPPQHRFAASGPPVGSGGPAASTQLPEGLPQAASGGVRVATEEL